jgi:hypothetical protein
MVSRYLLMEEAVPYWGAPSERIIILATAEKNRILFSKKRILFFIGLFIAY